jgi:hypothetical protein
MKARGLMAAMLWALASAAMAAEPAGADRAQPAASPATSEAQQSKPAGDSTQPSSAQPAPARGSRPAGTRTDRLDLDTTVVTGNRELPKVLYIVPWKKADIGDLPGQPFNTLLDEALTPVDRDVFRREVTYYGAISVDSDDVGAASPAAPQRTGGTEK